MSMPTYSFDGGHGGRGTRAAAATQMPAGWPKHTGKRFGEGESHETPPAHLVWPALFFCAGAIGDDRSGRVIPPAADAEFAANMEEVLETYAKPYDPAARCCAPMNSRCN